MTYRGTACSFCENPATLACSRCTARVCAAHGPSRQSHCSECEDERAYLVEVAETEEILRCPEVFDGSGLGSRRGDTSTIDMARLAMNAISRPFRRRRARLAAEDEFRARTPEAIAAWRAQRAQGPTLTSS